MPVVGVVDTRGKVVVAPVLVPGMELVVAFPGPVDDVTTLATALVVIGKGVV